jgi:hypothetical protein
VLLVCLVCVDRLINVFVLLRLFVVSLPGVSRSFDKCVCIVVKAVCC